LSAITSRLTSAPGSLVRCTVSFTTTSAARTYHVDRHQSDSEGQIFDNVDERDVLGGFARDTFVEIRLTWYF
jgi:hypothetical protein